MIRVSALRAQKLPQAMANREPTGKRKLEHFLGKRESTNIRQRGEFKERPLSSSKLK